MKVGIWHWWEWAERTGFWVNRVKILDLLPRERVGFYFTVTCQPHLLSHQASVLIGWWEFRGLSQGQNSILYTPFWLPWVGGSEQSAAPALWCLRCPCNGTSSLWYHSHSISAQIQLLMAAESDSATQSSFGTRRGKGLNEKKSGFLRSLFKSTLLSHLSLRSTDDFGPAVRHEELISNLRLWS